MRTVSPPAPARAHVSGATFSHLRSQLRKDDVWRRVRVRVSSTRKPRGPRARRLTCWDALVNRRSVPCGRSRSRRFQTFRSFLFLHFELPGINVVVVVVVGTAALRLNYRRRKGSEKKHARSGFLRKPKSDARWAALLSVSKIMLDSCSAFSGAFCQCVRTIKDIVVWGGKIKCGFWIVLDKGTTSSIRFDSIHDPA